MKANSILFLFAAYVISSQASADSLVEWSSLSAAGNGCPGGSAELTMTPDGSELSWTTDSYQFSLQGSPSSKAVFCRLNAGAKVPKGYYLESLTQKATFGASKSKDGSLLELGFQGRFLGHSLDPLSRRYEEGQDFNYSKVTLIGRQKFEKYMPASEFCANTEDTAGLFQGTFSTIAQTSNPDAKVSFGVQGMTVTYRAQFKWARCPDATATNEGLSQ